MGKLTSKTALTTNALQGIGEGIARTFVCYDANLALLDISPKIEKLANELYGHGHYCMAAVVDVRDSASVVVAIKRAKEREGHIDILVSNAGACRPGSFLDMNDEDRDLHTGINIEDIQNVMKTVPLEMIARKDDRTVMISLAIDDTVIDPGEAAYALTKVATAGLTESLAMEYAQSGIRINAICPGYARTPMAENIARQSNPEDPESMLTEMVKTIPMRHLVDPLEIGELAIFLASDESSYSTGTRNVINGDSMLLETVSVGI